MSSDGQRNEEPVMSSIAGTIVLSGLLLLDGKGLGNQRILVLSEDMTRLLGSGATGPDGRFAVELPLSERRDGKVVLVARIQGPVLAVAHRAVTFHGGSAPAQEIRVDTQHGFHTIRGVITGPEKPAAPPPAVQLSITPAHLDGVPAPIERFFLRQSTGVIDASFLDLSVTDRKLEVKVQAGTWRIAGGHIDYRRSSRQQPGPENLVVDRIEADGEKSPLPGERLGGFSVDVHRDRRLSLHLGVLPDRELSP
jgi:hypothetical protein